MAAAFTMASIATGCTAPSARQTVVDGGPAVSTVPTDAGMDGDVGRSAGTISKGDLACVAADGGLTQCVLRDVPIGSPIVEADQTWETEFDAHYSFVCPGSGRDFALQSGSAVARLSEGRVDAPIFVIGNEPAVITDAHPEATARATVPSGCTLEIRGVKVLPSDATASAWMDQARAQATTIDGARHVFAIATGYGSDTSASDLGLLRAKVASLVTAQPINAGIGGDLENDIDARIANRPSTVAPSEVQAALGAVVQELAKERDDAVADGRAWAARLARWGLLPEPALERALLGAAGS